MFSSEFGSFGAPTPLWTPRFAPRKCVAKRATDRNGKRRARRLSAPPALQIVNSPGPAFSKDQALYRVARTPLHVVPGPTSRKMLLLWARLSIHAVLDFYRKWESVAAASIAMISPSPMCPDRRSSTIGCLKPEVRQIGFVAGYVLAAHLQRLYYPRARSKIGSSGECLNLPLCQN